MVTPPHKLGYSLRLEFLGPRWLATVRWKGLFLVTVAGESQADVTARAWGWLKLNGITLAEVERADNV